MSRDLQRALETLDRFCAIARQRPERKRVLRRLDLALSVVAHWLAVEAAAARAPRDEVAVQLQIARIRLLVFESEPVRSERVALALGAALSDLRQAVDGAREASQQPASNEP